MLCSFARLWGSHPEGISMPTKSFDRQSAAVLLLGWVVALITTLT
ncbi:MAG: hypothetical protein ABSG66_11345 [Stellaceae bacterium]